MHRARDLRRSRLDLPNARERRLRIPIVLGDGDERRTGRALHRHVVGARDRGRNVFGARRLAAPLDVGSGQRGRIGGEKERFVAQHRAGLLSGQDDERRAVAKRGKSVPIALPRPPAECRLTRAAFRVTCAYASAIATTQPSCSPMMYRKSDGHSARNFNSVDPGIAEHRRHPVRAQNGSSRLADRGRSRYRFWSRCLRFHGIRTGTGDALGRIVIQRHVVNSSMFDRLPKRPPFPDAPNPPNGDARIVVDGLVVDVHESGPSTAARCASARSTSAEKIAADRPYSVWLASAIASSSSLNVVTGATGPKISSVNAASAAVTLVRTVGR